MPRSGKGQIATRVVFERYCLKQPKKVPDGSSHATHMLATLAKIGIKPKAQHFCEERDRFTFDEVAVDTRVRELEAGKDLSMFTYSRRQEILAARTPPAPVIAAIPPDAVDSVVAAIETSVLENTPLLTSDFQLILDGIADIKAEQLKQRERDRLMYQAVQKLNENVETLNKQWQ